MDLISKSHLDIENKLKLKVMVVKTKDDVRAEALEAIRKHLRSGVAVSMGVGKTRLGLEHFQLVTNKRATEGRAAKALVVAPKKSIFKEWKDEAVKWKLSHLAEHITFVSYRSLTKMNPADYDVVYLDECHSLKSSHRAFLNSYMGYIVGLTGTPPKYEKSDKGRMIKSFCPIVYTYLTEEAIDDKILNDYTITVHLLELSQEKNHKIVIKDKKTGRVTNSWYTSEQENYDYWTDRIYDAQEKGSSTMQLSIMRMKSMQVFRSKDEYAKRLLDQSKVKTLLFANEQSQADSLCAHSYHSNNKASEENMKKFISGAITKMSCVLQLGEGANIPRLMASIILHAYGNNRKAAQRIGRALRLNPDETAHIDILAFKNTVDEKWVKEALEAFNPDKISYYDTTII